MRAEIPLLQNVRVAAPCPVDWNGMAEVEGDRVKFCSGCQKRVYNLSAMGQAEAEGLLRRHEGHLCVRYYRRRDGTILTTDCPVGLKAARELAFRRAQASFAACVLFCVGIASYRSTAPVKSSTGTIPPVIQAEPEPVPQYFVEQKYVDTQTEESDTEGFTTGIIAIDWEEDILIHSYQQEDLTRGPILRAFDRLKGSDTFLTNPEKHE